jgi:hypothetical protein
MRMLVVGTCWAVPSWDDLVAEHLGLSNGAGDPPTADGRVEHREEPERSRGSRTAQGRGQLTSKTRGTRLPACAVDSKAGAMTTNHDLSPFEPAGARWEIAQLLRQIHALTIDLAVLRERAERASELQDRERDLERLRWRLAIVARRAAVAGSG